MAIGGRFFTNLVEMINVVVINRINKKINLKNTVMHSDEIPRQVCEVVQDKRFNHSVDLLNTYSG